MAESARLREEYYVEQPEYFVLKNLAELIRLPTTTSQDLIDYLTVNHLDPNSYLIDFSENQDKTFSPIIYQIVLTDKYLDFYKWLIAHRADPKKLPDGVDSSIQDILFVCHERYLPDLVKRGVKATPRLLGQEIRVKLHHANLRRLKVLLELKVITSADIQAAVRNLNLTTVINTLADRIYLVFRTTNDKSDADFVTNKYLKLFQFCINHGLAHESVTQEVIKGLLGLYLHEIITLLERHGYRPVELARQYQVRVVYHEQMTPTTVCKMRQLLNDNRYVQTCRVLGQKPEEEAFAKPDCERK